MAKVNSSKWVVFFAIAMMVSSALISYFFVRQNEPLILALKNEVSDKQNFIRDTWNELNQKDRMVDTAIIISLSKDAGEIKKQYLAELGSENITDILTAAKKEKATKIEAMDNLYLEQVTLQNKISDLEMLNKRYSDIAFFLQIFGLVLIILKKEIPY